MVFTNTNDASYWQPLRPKITFKSIDDVTTYFTFDAFSGSNPIVISELSCERAVGENGSFNITVNDNDNVIDETGLRSAKVYIQLGKTSGTQQYFMIGYADVFAIDRPASRYQNYQLTGFGTEVQASQLFLHRRQTFDKDETSARIHRLTEDALTKRNWRPLKNRDKSIQDLTGWDESGIDSNVNIPFTVVNLPLVYFNDFMDTLSQASGSVWFVDVSTGSEIFTRTYSTALHTGVTIKSGDLKVGSSDDADKTSYINKTFKVEDNATSEAGIATRLITTQILDKEQVFAIVGHDGSTTLTFRAIAQQVIIDNDARRIDSLEFELEKVGDPTSPKDRINGDIVLDVNNKPTGTVLDEFSIPLSDLKDHRTTVTVDNIDVSQKKLSAGQTKIWVRLFQRSNEEDVNGDPDGNGNPNHGTKHTVKVYHNNQFNTTQTVGGNTIYSAQAPEGDADKKSSLSWTVTNQGPSYNVDVNSNIRRIFARTNKKAANILRMREVFVDTAFLSDTRSPGRYLSLGLSQTSKPRRALDIQVRVPNNFIFRPYQLVSFNDGLSGISEDLQVKRVSYTCGSANSDDTPIGTLYANITLGGSYNTLTSNCNCA